MSRAATISSAAGAATGANPDPHAANPAARGWSAAEFRNRQREQIALIEAGARDNQPQAVRAATLTMFNDTADMIEQLSRQADAANADRTAMQALIDQQRALGQHLTNLTEAALAGRNHGGRNANLRCVESEDDGRVVAAAIIRNNPAVMEMMRGNTKCRSTLEAVESIHRDLTGASGSGDGHVLSQRYEKLVGLVQKFTNVFQHVYTLPMVSGRFEFPRRGTRARGYRVGRAAAVTASEPGNPTNVQVDPQEYAGLGWFHERLLEDANLLPALGDIAMEDIVDGIARILEGDVVLGVKDAADGTMEYNPGAFWFNGFLKHASVPTLTIQSGQRYESATFKDYLLLQNAHPTKYGAFPKSYHMHRSQLFNLMGQTDAQGRHIWVPPTQGVPGTIWGAPYALWERMPATSDSGSQAGKPFVSYGVMNRAYIVGTRRELTFRKSEHYRFPERMVGIMGVAVYAADVWETDALVNLKTNN